jgi:heptosyltransferase I
LRISNCEFRISNLGMSLKFAIRNSQFPISSYILVSLRILIVKLSSIGDIVHTLPAVAALRRGLPKAHISWVVERRAGAILDQSPVIDELIEVDSRAWRKQWYSAPTLREIGQNLNRLKGYAKGAGREAHRQPFDIAIDFQGLIKSGLLAFASRTGTRIGFETPDLREPPSRLFLTEQVETTQFNHIIDKNLALARRVLEVCSVASPGLDGTDIGNSKSDTDEKSIESAPKYEFPISVARQDDLYIEQAVGEGRFAIINPGGGWPTKIWPAERYGQIADWLKSEQEMQSYVTYGPGEELLAEAVVRSSRSGAVRPLASTLKQFVALARRADLFVGGDTGPLHLAAACHTPIVGLYGPTSPVRNGPFDPRDVTIGRDLWCRTDCHKRGCWHWECMEIPVTEVEHGIEQRLAAERE